MKKYAKRLLLLFAVLCMGMFVLAACGGNGDTDTNNGAQENDANGNDTQDNNTNDNGTEENNNAQNDGQSAEGISIGTIPAGTTFHTLGTVFSDMVNNNSSLSLTVRPFAGTEAWMPLLNSGEIDLGTDTYFAVSFGFEGRHNYDQPNENVRTLMMGARSPIAGLAVREDAGVESISDLEGKRVASEYAGNIQGREILRAHMVSGGLDWDDVNGMPVADNPSGIEALREGRVDAAFAGRPTNSMFLEADQAVGIHGLNWGDIPPEEIDSFPQEILDEVSEILPGASPTLQEEGFLNEEQVIMDFPLTVVVGEHVSDDVVYELMETMWEHYEDLEGTMIEDWTPEVITAEVVPPAPYHEGVIQFLKDKDVWTDEHEEAQQELLDMIGQ